MQHPPGAIHCGRVFERSLRLRLNVRETKFLCGLVAFLPIALFACQREIGHTIAASTYFWNDMLELKR